VVGSGVVEDVGEGRTGKGDSGGGIEDEVMVELILRRSRGGVRARPRASSEVHPCLTCRNKGTRDLDKV